MLSRAFPPPARNRQPSKRIALFALTSALLSIVILTSAAAAAPQAAPARNPLVISGTPPAAVVGVGYSSTFTVSGGTAPYTFSISRGQLPQGLTLGKTTGTISGSPTKSGTYNFGVHATDSSNKSGTQPFKITTSDPPNVIVTVTPPIASVISAGTVQFSALVTNTSNTAVTWSASSGTIASTGLYTAPTVTADSSATVTGTSVAQSTSAAVAAVTITAPPPPPLAITVLSPTAAISGTAYSFTLAATGGKTPYTWSLSSGSLPSGITVQSSGLISGTAIQTGQFSFSIQVSDSSSAQETVTEALNLTVGASTAGNMINLSFFGAEFNASKSWPGTDAQNQSATIVGIRLWDDGVKWGQINTASGVYDWTNLDSWLDDAQGGGLDVLYTFGDTPQFAAVATAPNGCLSPGAYSCAAPADVNADGTGTDANFQAFVTALVTHAAGRIAFYELWNEPDYSGFWSGNQAQLVRMGKDAAAIIRSLDPAAKILSPSAHGGSMATWFDGYIAAGGTPNFDIVNVHMRGTSKTNSTPEAFLTAYGLVQTELAARNLTSLPIWDDEHGILLNQGVTDPDMLAGYVARGLILRAGVGLQRQYIYTWDNPWPLYALEGNQAGTAWNVVAGWLIGHSISACTATATVYTCALEYGQIVWDTAQTCSNGTCTTSNYTFPSGYVWYHDIAGNRSALSGSTVTIGYKPILLENQ